MRKLLYYLFILSGLFFSSLSHAQIVLEALEGGIDFTPSPKCLELVYDRNYGDGEHDYIYCAVQGPNGKMWLNLNLGAEYAKEDSPYFNPEAQPVNNQDWKAFGNLFQYGRKADGHEIVTYLTDTDPVPTGYWKVDYKYPTTTVKQNAFNSNNQTVRRADWYTNQPAALDNGWVGNMTNNPCPSGYRVMNATDVYAFVPNQSMTVDLSGITSETTPGIVRNTAYRNLTLMLSPSITYVVGAGGVYELRKPAGSTSDWYFATDTNRINKGFPGTAGVHLADTSGQLMGYDEVSRRWYNGGCNEIIGLRAHNTVIDPNYVPGMWLDIYCTEPLVMVREYMIGAVRCVEQ